MGSTDTIKLLFTYALATAVIIGGGLMLFLSRNEGATDFQLVAAGFIGAAISFVFSQESATRATRAAEKKAESGSAVYTEEDVVRHMPPAGSGVE